MAATAVATVATVAALVAASAAQGQHRPQQIDIGIEIADMACEDNGEDESTMDSILSLIKQMLTRDEGWKEYYISGM